MKSNKVSTLWVEGQIRLIDQVCLKSMVRAGLDVTLFHYGPLQNVPAGVKLADARGVLDLGLLDRLQMRKRIDRAAWQPIANFSDFFRVYLQKFGLGLWLDSDVFIFHNFEYDTERPFFAKEDRHRIGSPVFYLPADHPIIGEYERLVAQPELLPNWLGIWRGIVRPTWWKLTRQEFVPPDLGITIYGNDAFTRLAKRHRCYGLAMPSKSFYALNGKETERLFHDCDFRFLLDDPEHIGIHIHRKQRGTMPAEAGSFWEWALLAFNEG